MQNWNNILQYVKANLGLKSSELEFTDDEIIEYLKNHTLPYFSQISPLKAWTVINKYDTVKLDNVYGGYVYNLNIPDDINLIDIQDVYFVPNVSQYINAGFYIMNPVDRVIANVYMDIHEYLRTVNDFEFIKPCYIKFSESFRSNNLIIELNVEHVSPNTIPSDLYYKLFKDMCLLNSLELVLNNRNKFNNISTPFGDIELNVSQLENKIQDLRQKINDIIDTKPHRKFLEFF